MTLTPQKAIGDKKYAVIYFLYYYDMTDKEMSSDELMTELQWRNDLSSLVNGDGQATSEMTGETGDQTQEESEATTSDESKTQDDWEKKEEKKSNFQKAMEKKNRTIAEKDELIASKDQRIADLEKQLKEAQERDDYEDIDEKEEEIQSLKNDLSYERNRRNEIKSEKSRMREWLLGQMMDEMNISAESQNAIKEMAKQDAYKDLEPEDIISLYNGKVWVEYDQHEMNKRAGGTSVLWDNRQISSNTIENMGTKEMEQELTRQIKSGNSPF